MIYVKPEGPTNAKIMLVGEAPGEVEEREGGPFRGPAGYELTTELREAGIPRQDCFITNVCRFRPNNNDLSLFITPNKKEGLARGHVFYEGMWVAPFVKDHLNDLYQEIERVNPNVIVALGNTPFWALAGKTGITKWRGSQMQLKSGRKLVPVVHPAAIMREYEQRAIAVNDFKNRVKVEAQSPLFRPPEYQFTLRPSLGQVIAFLNGLLAELAVTPHRKVSIDIETRQGQIACLGLGTSSRRALCIPFLCIERSEGYWPLDEELLIIEKLRQVLTHRNLWGIGQNFLYDAQYIIKQWRFIPYCCQDTSVWHHVAFCGLLKRLEFLASLYADYYCYWKDDGKEWTARMNEEELWHYNCLDCVYTYEVAERLEETTAKINSRKQILFQQSLFYPVLDMMLTGVKIDTERRRKVGQELDAAIRERQSYFKTVLGHELSTRSPAQMQRLFYTDFRQPPSISRKSHNPTLDDKALEKIAKKEIFLQPLILAIQQERSLNVFKSTFVEAELDPDGRMRCSYNLTGTETFRFSSSKNAFGRGTNLQNIPKGEGEEIALYCALHGPKMAVELATAFNYSTGQLWNKLDKALEVGSLSITGRGDFARVSPGLILPNIRKMFIPDENHFIMDWDLDRADLQVVAWEADDEVLMQQLREGADIHKENAKDLLCTRDVAKRWVHGTDYGGSSRTMALNCGITVHASDIMQKRYFAAHPGILSWHRRTERSLATTRSVYNAFGYRRLYFGRADSLLPQALAWIPQSTVAIVINTGLIRIYHSLKAIQLLLQVHDSLVMQTHRDNVPAVFPQINEALRVVIPYPKPLTIPVSGKGSYTSWGDCEKIAVT